MKRKSAVLFTVLALVLTILPTTVLAEYALPTSVGAPAGFAITYYEAHQGGYMGFEATATASKELRALVDEAGTDNSAFLTAGYTLNEVAIQMDYSTENGSWHTDTDWDSNYTIQKSSIRIEKGVYTTKSCYTLDQIRQISSSETVPEKTAYFDSHTWQFRIRFMVVVQDKEGTYYTILSPWTTTYAFSNKKASEDPKKLINHAPVLTSATVKKYADGKPYLEIISEPPHTDVTHLNLITGNCVNTEVWIKVGTGDWKLCNYDGNFIEQFNVDAIAGYFGGQDKVEAAVYDAKIRYKFDYFHYPTAGKSGLIYSPFSNVISHGLGAWSNASKWAASELVKADEMGLIPESLKGADMTKPITREEFAEVSLLLYEKATGKSTGAYSPNPFKDTKNERILKAFKLGIVKGTSATTFSPKELINREQVATMLSRNIRIIAPDADLSTTGAPEFIDQKDISSWALEHVMVVSKIGIIKGVDGKFMAKATTTVQKATGYANTTREQALAMSVRTIENMNEIKGN